MYVSPFYIYIFVYMYIYLKKKLFCFLVDVYFVCAF